MAKAKRRWNSDIFPKVVTVRVTIDEHRKIHERADRASLSASRYLVRRGLELKLPPLRSTLPASSEERRQIELALIEIRRVGVNLNQLARSSNRAKLFGTSGPTRSRVHEAATQAGILIKLLQSRL